jgi:membrane protease YdiL (CAAX protease family)
MTQVFSGLLVLTTLAIVAGSVVRGRNLARRVEARPDGRVWLYRNFVLRMWPLMLLPVATVWASNRLTAADLGWARPHGFWGYAFAAYYLLAIGLGCMRLRRAMRRGAVFAQRQRIAFMIPRTAGERWWVVALSITAGVVEETIFRGALIGVGTKVYHLPILAAAGAALFLFAAGHLYQGWRGFVGSALIGFVVSFIYVISGSLLLPIVAHALHDLISMLLVPANSTPPPPTPPTPPTETQAQAQAHAPTPVDPKPSTVTATPAPTWKIPRPPAPTVRAATPDAAERPQ